MRYVKRVIFVADFVIILPIVINIVKIGNNVPVMFEMWNNWSFHDLADAWSVWSLHVWMLSYQPYLNHQILKIHSVSRVRSVSSNHLPFAYRELENFLASLCFFFSTVIPHFLAVLFAWFIIPALPISFIVECSSTSIAVSYYYFKFCSHNSHGAKYHQKCRFLDVWSRCLFVGRLWWK